MNGANALLLASRGLRGALPLIFSTGWHSASVADRAVLGQAPVQHWLNHPGDHTDRILDVVRVCWFRRDEELSPTVPFSESANQ